jgi:hypothetical protein
MYSINVHAGGLSTYLASVSVNNLEPGKKYSLKQTTNISLRVLNTGDSSVNLKIDVLNPQPGELEPGYEKLPDTSWLKIEKDYFTDVSSGAVAETDVYITVPDSKLYLGKKYQAYLWSHTVGDPGAFGVGVGLSSKLLIGIIDYKASGTTDSNVKPSGFKAEPGELNLKIKPGKKEEQKIKITNTSSQKQRYLIGFISGQECPDKKNKYELISDTVSVTCSEKEFQLEPGTFKEITINIMIPDKTKKKLFSQLRIDCLSEKKQEGMFCPVYIKVK